MAKILIVEDDEAVRELAARALRRDGHEIQLATDGADGLSRIRAAGGRFELVVTDVRMPMMTGIEMTKAAHEEFPDLKVLIVTGYADQREQAAEVRAAVCDVLQKPFSIASLRECVSACLLQGKADAA